MSETNAFSWGFTLIEVLIALVILVVGILAWVHTQQEAVLSRGQSRTMTVAEELLQSKVEELALDPERFCNNSTCQDQETCTQEGFEYTLSWELSRKQLQAGSEPLSQAWPLWSINVTASWQFQGQKELSAHRLATGGNRP
ncbi:MAG: prepilin-type N-terminal cleavage/methylation domain-containing protein [Desulfohalobiaceae bacterium]